MDRLNKKPAKEDSRRLYNDLSWVWSIVGPPEDYIEEAELFAQTIRQHAKIPAKTILNLGCGAGGNDMTLKKYFTLTGVDLSENMLRQARRLNPEASYLVGDMRNVRLEQTFDAVTILDCIDYNRTEAHIRATFETAYAHLKPGGVFLTVIEYDPRTFSQNSTHVEIKKKGDVEVTYIENNYDP
ncbi:MAG: class I SAM-dependent methyltransferase, partial [bacterium]|nr:class I SAM-dependent methyltransferase [bacterium]